MTLRVVLCDDHRIFREGLKALIEKTPGMQVVGQAEDGPGALERAKELSPDVVVMDITLPRLNGIETTRRIVALRRGIKVVALSMHSDRRFVTEALRAGASAYLAKDSAFEELSAAISAVLEGKTYLSPSIAGVVVDGCLDPARGGASPASKLTSREREVLQLLSEGLATKEAALRLGLSVKTVETHRMHIMEKLGIRSIAGLTKYSIREGLTSL